MLFLILGCLAAGGLITSLEVSLKRGLARVEVPRTYYTSTLAFLTGGFIFARVEYKHIISRQIGWIGGDILVAIIFGVIGHFMDRARYREGEDLRKDIIQDLLPEEVRSILDSCVDIDLIGALVTKYPPEEFYCIVLNNGNAETLNTIRGLFSYLRRKSKNDLAEILTQISSAEICTLLRQRVAAEVGACDRRVEEALAQLNSSLQRALQLRSAAIIQDGDDDLERLKAADPRDLTAGDIARICTMEDSDQAGTPATDELDGVSNELERAVQVLSDQQAWYQATLKEMELLNTLPDLITQIEQVLVSKK